MRGRSVPGRCPRARCLRVLGRAAVVLSGGCVALALWPASPAAAHAVLMHTAPVAGAVLDSAPTQVTLRFSEPVRPVSDQTRVVGPDGARADDGAVDGSGANLVLRLRPGLGDGTYRVSYRVVSVDGHPLAGAFSYSVGTPSQTAGAVAPAPTDRAAEDPVVAIAVPVARYLGFTGLILIVGPVLFLAAWWPARLDRGGPARLALAGAGVLALATVAELYLQAPYATGAGVFGVRGQDLLEAATSRVGLALLARLGLLLLALPLLVRIRRGPEAVGTPLAVLAVLALATWPISGHTGSSAAAPLTILTDSVHLGAVAFWLGGLVVLLGYVLRHATGEDLARIMPAWSRRALVAVAALASAGLIQAVVEVPSVAALTGTRYGQLLLAKVGVFAVILAAAFVARRAVARRDPGGPPRSRLRRTVATELGLAAVVLGLTAVLVQTAPAGTALAQTGPGYQVTLGTPLCSLRLEIQPARVGVNTIQLAAVDPDGRPVPVDTWLVTATLRGRGLTPVTASVRPVSADQATGTVDLPRAGRWRLHIAVHVVAADSGADADSDPDSASVNTTLTVSE